MVIKEKLFYKNLEKILPQHFQFDRKQGFQIDTKTLFVQVSLKKFFMIQ